MKLMACLTLTALTLFSSKMIFAIETKQKMLFEGGRFPNLISIIGEEKLVAIFGSSDGARLRFSGDRGANWSNEIHFGDGIFSGGTIYSPSRNKLYMFTEAKHPPAKANVHITDPSFEDWEISEMPRLVDKQGNEVSLHMSDTGIEILQGVNAGRLIRPARVYVKGRPKDEYNTAIYSDDGKEWKVSGRFPVLGSGEGAIVELGNGALLYSSRRHAFKNVEDFSSYRWFAISRDGGVTWILPRQAMVPDGPRYRGVEGRGSSHRNHFGLMGGLDYIEGCGHSRAILYSSADTDSHERINLAVWTSTDLGDNWSLPKPVTNSYSAYSTIAVLPSRNRDEDSVFFLYEGGLLKEYEGGFLTAFSFNELGLSTDQFMSCNK